MTRERRRGGYSRMTIQIFIFSKVIRCWPDLSGDPVTAVGAAIEHVRKSGSGLITSGRSVTTGTRMQTGTMGPTVLACLGTIAAAVVVTVVVPVVVAIIVAIIVAVVLVAIVVAVSRAAAIVIIAVGIAVIITVVPHHGRHHFLHLREDGRFTRLEVSLPALETVRNVSGKERGRC